MSVEDPQKLIGFLEDAFFAKEQQRTIVGGKIRKQLHSTNGRFLFDGEPMW
jgi:hypothetical protein